MQGLLKIFLLIIISSTCFAQEANTESKINYYSEKASNYLDKEKSLSPYYLIDSKGISIYANAQNKKNNIAEFFVSWKMKSIFEDKVKMYSYNDLIKNYFKTSEFKLPFGEVVDGVFLKHNENELKLKGYRIAIDAGHTAGNVESGKIESKYLKFGKDDANGIHQPIEFAEGMLTFATASLLKQKLEAEGAEVFLTRKANGETAFGKTFEQWLNDDYKNTIDSLFKNGKISQEKKNYYLNSKFTKRDKFKIIFKDLELQKRAEIINNFKPDFTIIIHFNVDETNTGWAKPSTKNFNMTFVGGAFMKSDLSTPQKRFEFLRLLITDDLEKSIALSSSVVKNFETILKTKTASINDAKYLTEGCLATSANGVYCRNLQLTRYIHSPLVYGETLYQDNMDECKLLNKEADKKNNKRIQQVADAYFQGILNFVKSTNSID